MDIYYIIIFFIGLIIFYIMYKEHFILFKLFKNNKNSKFIKEFCKNVNGKYLEIGYFAKSHKIVGEKLFKTYSDNHKGHFKECEDIILFKSNNAKWEIFFYELTDDSLDNKLVLNIRVFPEKSIKSEAIVDLIYSKIEIHSNSRYFAKILENGEAYKNISWLVKNSYASLSFLPNNIHYRFFFKDKTFSKHELMKIIGALNYLQKNVYKKGVIEY